MSVGSRLGSAVKDLVSLVLVTLSIATEALKIAANHLDGFVDDLNAKVKA